MAAQQDQLRDILLIAEDASWQVRVYAAADTAEGIVRSVFRDTVRIGAERIFIPFIERVDRRTRHQWRTVWPRPADQLAESADTARYRGLTTHLYAGPMMLVFPAVFLALPPPVVAGIGVAARGVRSELTVNARTLLYPSPLLLFALDVGGNFFDERSYVGVAGGAIFSTEGLNMVPHLAGRFGVIPHRTGTRFELRSDFILVESEIGILLSATIGFSRGVR